MKILLTGASGFLGSALALHFQRLGHDVSLLLRPASSLARLQGMEARFRVGRPADLEQVQAFVRDVQPDAIVHTACLYGRQGESLLQLTQANVGLGVALLDAAQHLVRPAVFVNTGTVLDATVNAYALSKHQFAQWGKAVAGLSQSKVQWLNVLLQHMYGPGDDPSKFTTHVLRSCLRNAPTLQLTEGAQRRDLIHIDDVVTAYQAILDHARGLPPSLDIQVGSGQAPTIRAFVELVHRLTGSTTQLQFGALPYRVNEAMHCQADLAQMRELGWAPRYDLPTGLQKTIELESP